MAILITGATGFIGQHLVKSLSKDWGEDQIYVLVRSLSKWKKLNLPGIPLQGDLEGTDFSFLRNIKTKLETVIHTAGLVHSHNPDSFYQVNTKGTEQLVVALREHLGPDETFHFIAFSSLAAFGPNTTEALINEESLPAPVSDYGKSKLKSEEALLKLAPNHWRKTIIRPPMVIGPDDPATLDVFKLVAQRLYLQVGGAEGDKKLYSFVCVHDLVQMVIEIIKQEPKELNSQNAQSYFAAFPKPVSYKELHEKARQILGIKKLYTIPLPELLLRNLGPFISKLHNKISFLSPFLKNIRLSNDKIKEILPSSWCCSSEKFSKDYQFTFKWDLEKTLENALNSYKQKGQL